MKTASASEWDDLVQKHLDGLTSQEEANRLSARIVADPELRSQYLHAAQVHGALADETLALELDEPVPMAEPTRSRDVRRFWSGQIAAALVAGALVGLLGLGGVMAVNSPKSEASRVFVSNGDFEQFSGPVDSGFPSEPGRWSGNPAEVVEEADGNRVLRLLQTANVKGDGGASNCSVFQLVDLSSLHRQWAADEPEAQISLKLSARFRRDPAHTDAEYPKLKAVCRIFLFDAEPASIGEQWPASAREAVALGRKHARIKPGQEPRTISASCLLTPDAKVALISVAASVGSESTTPVELGGYFVDDIELTVIKQPKLPVRFVSR